MPPHHDTVHELLRLRVNGVNLKIAAARTTGRLAPVVFLHGFGGTKEDYTDVVLRPAFHDRPVIVFDAPGCGASECADLAAVDIPFLADTARAVVDHLGVNRFHLVGHSMGGVSGLLLAHRQPGRVLSFVNMHGNLTPQDCFLSRPALSGHRPDFFAAFAEDVRRAPGYAAALYATGLPHKVRRGAARGILESMVELSDHGGLMPKFLSLPCPRMFLYGEEHAGLPYLPQLDANGVELAEIPHSGHFPMYSNPVAMWRHIAEFHQRVESGHGGDVRFHA
ncbi:alpha/beta fold hydrolase [Nocardia sp. NRRL S-836]|uniref:alpha/beta fold hydrolase n=1 Tax=Nocardia sp. NRRL S-836 TaxID=1519492 RepID=UPI0006AFB79B|nr:alpha/beta hydrolase [Nocardia sp. NRRL S-836]KOV84531.1 alpha/beta hydrolase [Nocardia sp. NRRL S-836]